MRNTLNRRSVLRGMVGGSAVTLGLPLLDIFLNTHGTALADGSPLPKCFVTWFQALAFTPGFWEPTTSGANYEVGPQLRGLAHLSKKMNVFSGMKLYADQSSGDAHVVGPPGVLQGSISHPNLPTMDQIVADTIGTRTRFRSIEVSCDGARSCYSRRSATSVNAAEPDPVKVYLRIFGPDFKDPNAADFTPDPETMVRKSLLSGLKDKRDALLTQVGAADKARLDEYFTALRSLENRLEIELRKPAPLESCRAPEKVDPVATGRTMEDGRVVQRLHASLLAHAMACGQTQVAHLKFGNDFLRKGSQQTHHMLTHEEVVDPAVGYQKGVEWFSNNAAEALAEFATTYETLREGAGCLLDRTVIVYATDCGFARTHSFENVPMLTIGSGGGALKTGIHYNAKSDPLARVGLTVMQAMGVPIGQWGMVSNTTSKTITEVLA